ncbi:hypothetical protein COY17_03695 [Candidatus Saccharibacteria bacterium CG_4_10_14_0_2_um_filter_52_9]|nr:MAG: hypothetical protein COY17_03695 [Candidatus Saccharibacteria bacterium CG_4_10_14_0_2_um_filter_52_9]
MPRKNPVIHEQQGAFLADAQHLSSHAEEVGEGYFNPGLTVEQRTAIDRLDAEIDTLMWLNIEDRSRRNIQNNENPQSVYKSKQALPGLILASKGAYARSKGIDAKTALRKQYDSDGRPLLDSRRQQIEKRDIVPTDEELQSDLDIGYISYRARYGGRHHEERLSRLADIEQAILSIYAGDIVIKPLHKPQKPIPTVVGELGTYTSLQQRSKHLTDAVRNINQKVMRLGFDTASNVPEHADPIIDRYMAGIYDVQTGAAKNAKKYHEKARRDFWQALGYQGLRAIEYASKLQLDARARQDWEGFQDVYGGRKSKDPRTQLLKQLKPHLPADYEETRRKAA